MISAKRIALHLASLLAVSSGFTTATRRWRHRRADFRVFILEYHDVSLTGEESEGTISKDRFRRHLRFLKRHYRPTTLSKAAASLRSEHGLSEDLVVVSLDDGYAGNFEAAWPALVEEGVPATIFLSTGFLDGSELWFDFARRALREATRLGPELTEELQRALTAAFGRWPLRGSTERALERMKMQLPAEREQLLDTLRRGQLPVEPPARPLTWAQVRQMQQSGVEIAGHTVSHPLLPSLPPALQEREIRGCRDRITEETGTAPATFAFPNGDYATETLTIVRRLGFKAACTTRRGSNCPGCDPFTLRRLGVGSDSTHILAARLCGLFDDSLRRWLPTSR